MRVFALLFALSSVAFCVVQAHFVLEYPPTRGFDKAIEPDNFCGGFHDVSATRAPWYYENGPVAIDSHHESATVNIYISFDADPSSAKSFLQTANGTFIPPLRHDLDLTGVGYYCFHANASALTLPGVEMKNGTKATLMVEYISTIHGHLYQCSDVVFSSNASLGSNLTCNDSLTSTAMPTWTTFKPAPAGTSTSSPTASVHHDVHNAAAVTFIAGTPLLLTMALTTMVVATIASAALL